MHTLEVAAGALALVGIGVLVTTPADARRAVMIRARDSLVRMAEDASAQARARAGVHPEDDVARGSDENA